MARISRIQLPRRAAGAAAAIALLAAPAAARAEEPVTLAGSAGADQVFVSSTPTPGEVYVEVEGAVARPSACGVDVGVGWRCTVGAAGLRVELGGGDDRFDVAVDGPAIAHPILADGGEGIDKLTGGAGPETLLGGAGDDALDGGAGDDQVDAGAGHDQLTGGAGADRVLGGEGDDRLAGDGLLTPGADLIDGGTGRDTLEDWSPAGAGGRGPVTISLDDGPGDGFAGEGDDVRGVEVLQVTSPGRITGTDHAEQIVVVNGPTTLDGRGGDDRILGGVGADELLGGAGADTLEGGSGGDAIAGGPGRDTISGDGQQASGFGPDVIDARDGEVDTVDCGPGADRVIADAADVVAQDCETVERPAGPREPERPGPGPGDRGPGDRRPQPGKPSARLRAAGGASLGAALRGGVRVRVSGVGGKVRLRATLPAAVARRARVPRVVARGSVRGRGAKVVVAKLAFTRIARARLARLKRVPLVVTVDGARGSAKLTLRR